MVNMLGRRRWTHRRSNSEQLWRRVGSWIRWCCPMSTLKSCASTERTNLGQIDRGFNVDRNLKPGMNSGMWGGTHGVWKSVIRVQKTSLNTRTARKMAKIIKWTEQFTSLLTGKSNPGLKNQLASKTAVNSHIVLTSLMKPWFYAEAGFWAA